MGPYALTVSLSAAMLASSGPQSLTPLSSSQSHHHQDQRDAARWPFASDSPWNYPLGRNAQFAVPVAAGSPAAGSPNMTAGFDKMGINAGQYTIPVFLASIKDRRCNFSRSSGPPQPSRPPCKPGDELEDCQVYSDEVFTRHVPANAVVSPGSDRHVAIVSPDRQTVIEGFGCNVDGNGGFSCLGSAKNVDLTGNGWDSFGVWGDDGHPRETAGNGTMSMWRAGGEVALPRPNAVASTATQLRLGSDGFVVAAGTSAIGGLIRSGELQNGIFHALQFCTNPWRWNRNCPGAKLRSWGAYVWPASSSDDPTHDEFGTSGNLYEGGLLAIPPTVNISTFPFRTAMGSAAHTAVLNLARAFQQYGLYGVDSGDVGGVQLRMEYTARGEMPALEGAFLADLATLAGHLRVVTNSFDPATGGKPRGGVRLHGGDGELLAPLAPPIRLPQNAC